LWVAVQHNVVWQDSTFRALNEIAKVANMGQNYGGAERALTKI